MVRSEQAQRRALRRRCEERLRHLDLPEPYDSDALIEQLAERRGRGIRVLPLPGGRRDGAPCGLWLAREREDWIFIESDTSPLHREHILLHELAHMIFGHGEQPGGEHQIPDLLGNLDIAMVRRVLSRTSYTTVEEQEAELLASLILARSRSAHPPAASSHPVPEVARVLDRTSRTLRRRRE